jgi:hypothetical protein
MVEITVNVTRTVDWVTTIPVRLRTNLQLAFERWTVMVLASVQRRLTGDVLHVRSGKLLRSAHNQVIQTSTVIRGTVQAGALAPYGYVHEYGGTFTIPAHLSASRLGKQFTVRKHQATFPERAYMRPSLAENHQALLDMTSRAVADSTRAA